jgi:hypothetical protein
MSDSMRALHEDGSANPGSCESPCSAESTKYPVGERRCIASIELVSHAELAYAPARSSRVAWGSCASA